jgi:hypothetical protein
VAGGGDPVSFYPVIVYFTLWFLLADLVSRALSRPLRFEHRPLSTCVVVIQFSAVVAAMWWETTLR